eukprot:TRINITY_DN10097_c0_g1_i2.p1 TRINITY_DN10097_c0_g1~~TRINITY_DN10097_c0_g1_i2.p1  ORF type:complete len:531 (-),score=111.78 TRINITY_DN10097_c0_g1_i2:43-1635(-)
MVMKASGIRRRQRLSLVRAATAVAAAVLLLRFGGAGSAAIESTPATAGGSAAEASLHGAASAPHCGWLGWLSTDAGQLLPLAFVSPGPSTRQASRPRAEIAPWAPPRGTENRQENAGSAGHKAGVVAAVAALCVALLGPPVELGQVWPAGPAPAMARQPLMTSGDGSRVNKDPLSLLSLALPLEEFLGENQVKPVRELESLIESASAATKIRMWDRAEDAVKQSLKLLKDKKKDLLKPIDASRKADAEALLTELEPALQNVFEDINTGASYGNARDAGATSIEETTAGARKVQELLAQFQELMMPVGYKPKLPDYVAKLKLPQLIGRAKVKWTITRGPDAGTKKFALDGNKYDKAEWTMICDGFSAPISAGNFIDLVNRGFYDGMSIQRADGFIIQTGDNGQGGFRPNGPKTPVRQIPLEVGIRGRKEALYSETMDEARALNEVPRIPFQVDGTIAMARAEFDDDSASSQVFLFLFEPDMTPAGKNFLDGRYGTFGYIIEGSKFLKKIKEGDIIEKVEILSGLDKLVQEK